MLLSAGGKGGSLGEGLGCMLSVVNNGGADGRVGRGMV